MKYIIKGSPNLSYIKKQVRGFQYVNEPVLRLIIHDERECGCCLEIKINKDLITFGDLVIIKNQINEVDINDPKNEEFVHFISEIYGFHGFNLDKFANDEGVLKGINMMEIEEYVNSLVELELEIDYEESDFTYKITNLTEGDYWLKNSLSDLIIV